jgi:TonB family protein
MLLRFIGSFGVALCVVLAMLWFGLEVSGFTDRMQRSGLETHEVSLLSDAERWSLRDLLGEGRHVLTPIPAAPGVTDSLDLSRELRGIVRLDVRVDASGTVEDVRVIDASPAGIYEAQAIAEIKGRRYAPEIAAGRAVPSRHLELVDFTLRPASNRPADRD